MIILNPDVAKLMGKKSDFWPLTEAECVLWPESPEAQNLALNALRSQVQNGLRLTHGRIATVGFTREDLREGNMSVAIVGADNRSRRIIFPITDAVRAIEYVLAFEHLGAIEKVPGKSQNW